MAKAGETTSTIDWMWLHDAYERAVPCFGSEELAEMRLRTWLASGQLPWIAMEFQGPKADDITRLEREDRASIVMHILPSAAYYNGDPQFWRAEPTVWWEKNAAREFSTFGARALGIRVSRTHLLALLPQDPGEDVEVKGAGVWLAAEAKRMKKANKIQLDIKITNFARELERRMKKAAVTNKSIRPIKARSIENLLRTCGLWPISSIK